MQTKVFKKFKMLREEQGKFSIEHKKYERDCKISQQLADQFNENSMDSGIIYVLDEEKTNLIFGVKTEKKELDPIFTKEEIKDIKEHAEEEAGEIQAKYNKRKDAAIKAGFEFDTEGNTFTRGEIVVTAQELLELNNIRYGKLLKN